MLLGVRHELSPSLLILIAQLLLYLLPDLLLLLPSQVLSLDLDLFENLLLLPQRSLNLFLRVISMSDPQHLTKASILCDQLL